jgi:hypothetical protein
VSFPSLQVPAPPSPKQKFDSGFRIRRAISAPISLPRSSTAFPLSRSFTKNPLDAKDSAAKRPQGPAPTIIIGLREPSEYLGFGGLLGRRVDSDRIDALSPCMSSANSARVILHSKLRSTSLLPLSVPQRVLRCGQPQGFFFKQMYLIHGNIHFEDQLIYLNQEVYGMYQF